MPSAFSIFFKKHIIGGLIITAAVFFASLLIYFAMVGDNYFLLSKTARLELDINGQKRAFEGEVVEGMTVLGALQASALAGNMSFNFILDEDGRFVIKSLDGYSEEDNKKIYFYLNYLNVEADNLHSVPIKAGDTVTIVVK